MEMPTGPPYDACIIGAGPGGLAALSALIEPYSADQLSEDQMVRAGEGHLRHHREDRERARGSKLRACVVDSQPWLHTWHRRFESLDIRWLRSPTGAHPDVFDSRGLLAYAVMHGREKELFDSGAVNQEIYSLAEAHTGLWHLPSNQLFEDFCRDLADRLPHTFVRGEAAVVRGSDGDFTVELADGREVKARSVVLALGVPGPPAVPPALAQVPPQLMFHSDFQLGSRLQELSCDKDVLVIGGGLTAVQAAQLAMKRGCRVTLCSRRPLTTRHFDVKETWFDRRQMNRHHFQFFEKSLDARLKHLKAARGGGSVPPMYVNELREAEEKGKVVLKVGEVQVVEVSADSVEVQIGEETKRCDLIVSACGHVPDCRNLPLVRELLEKAPVDVVGGFPALSQDLQWGDFRELFVIGALASLQVGPDAGNLMGLRRAAQIMANALGRRDWLKDTTSVLGNIRGNRFAALGNESGSEEESSDSEESGSERSESCGPEVRKLSTTGASTASCTVEALSDCSCDA